MQPLWHVKPVSKGFGSLHDVDELSQKLFRQVNTLLKNHNVLTVIFVWQYQIGHDRRLK